MSWICFSKKEYPRGAERFKCGADQLVIMWRDRLLGISTAIRCHYSGFHTLKLWENGLRGCHAVKVNFVPIVLSVRSRIWSRTRREDAHLVAIFLLLNFTIELMYACLRNKIQQEVQHSVSCFFVEEDFIGVFGFVLKVNLPAHPWYNNSIVSSLGLLLFAVSARSL